MLIISRCIIWLVVYGVVGWVYESTYCTVAESKWQNRGFLYGPICPIYGFGAILMMLGWNLILRAGLEPSALQVFVAVALTSAVLEYATSWALERLFHARWWDYSNMPLNLNGRICLPASLLFGLMGLLVVYVLYDVTIAVTNRVPLWGIEVLALVLVCLLSIDTTLTVSALTRFALICDSVSESVNAHMDKFFDGKVDAAARLRERERYATAASKQKLMEMGLSVRSAARRIYATSSESTVRWREQAERFLRVLRSKDELASVSLE